MKFYTEYNVNGRKYGSHVYAEDIKQAHHIVSFRNMDEVITGVGPSGLECEMPKYSQLTDEEFVDRLPVVLHTACYLSYIALKAKAVSLEAIIGDEGVIHELSHLLSGVEQGSSVTQVRDKLRELETAAVGVYDYPV